MPPFQPSPVTPASKSQSGVCPAGGKAGVSAAFPDDPSMSPAVFLIVPPRAGLGGAGLPTRGVRRRPPRGGGGHRGGERREPNDIRNPQTRFKRWNTVWTL